MHPINLVAWLLTLGYGSASLLYILHMGASRERFGAWGSRVLRVSALVHAIFLVAFTWLHRRLPLAHPSEAMTVLTWFAASVYLLAEWRSGERVFGSFLTPLLFLLQLIAALGLIVDRPVNPILRDVFFEVHAIANLFGYAAFTLSFIASLMYLLLYREVRQKQWGIFYLRFPSLQFLSEFSLRAGMIGLALLTVGIGMGIWNAVSIWRGGWGLDAKILAVFATWIIYGVFVLFTWRQGWVGRRNAYLSLFGFVWVLFSFLIISNFFSGIHSF